MTPAHAPAHQHEPSTQRHGKASVRQPVPALSDSGGSSYKAGAPANLPRFLRARDTPTGIAALAEQAGIGASVPTALRAPLEARIGSSLAAARLHQGPQVTAGLGALGAPAAALGRHVFLSSTAPAALVPQIIRHELAHVAQARLAEPEARRPLNLGPRGSALEGQASRLAAGARIGTRLGADANTLLRYDYAGASDLGMGDWQDWQAEIEAERRTDSAWRGFWPSATYDSGLPASVICTSDWPFCWISSDWLSNCGWAAKANNVSFDCVAYDSSDRT
jgi:hypothetical protein